MSDTNRHRNDDRRDDAASRRRSRSPVPSSTTSAITELSKLRDLSHPARRLPRHMLYEKKYVDLEQYIRDYRSHKIIGYNKLPTAKKKELFGSKIVPIHVPLAPGESAEQYEERFLQWLAKQRLTLAELVADRNDAAERYYRIRFTNLNATRVEAFVAPPRKRERPSACEEIHPANKKSTTKNGAQPLENATKQAARHEKECSTAVDRSSAVGSSSRQLPRSISSSSTSPSSAELIECRVQKPPRGATIEMVVATFTACGCDQCVKDAMRHLAAKITELDGRVS